MQRPSLFAAVAVAFLAYLASSTLVLAQPVRTPHVEAELVAARTALTPGQPLTVALRLAMQRGWHTYWQNPGDSGLPTTIDWKLPAGLSAGPIQWPVPRALPVGPLVNYGYEGEVLLLVDIAPAPEVVSGKPLTLAARVDWLVCKEICIPEGADLTLTLPVAAQADDDPRWGGPIAQARAALPRALVGWRANATAAGDKVELALSADGSAVAPGTLHFFPFAEGKIEASGVQIEVRDGARTTLMLPVARQRVGEFTRVAGLLTASNGFGAQRAATIDIPLQGTVAAARVADCRSSVAGAGEQRRARAVRSSLALAFAFVGGVLLNLMPCVFPVLSLKVLGFAAHRDSRLAMRMHGVAFAAGVVVSFWLLAAGLVALRAAGQQLGWGFQLQSPAVVVALAILFFVLALNLSGVFEMRQMLPSGLANWNARNPYVNDALVRRARGRHRVTMLRAVHGRGARLCADRIARGHVADFHGARRRHGTAVSAARIVPCMALETAEARDVDGSLAAVACVPALRNGRVAGLGPRCTSRQRCCRPSRRIAGARLARPLVVAGAAPRQSTWRRRGDRGDGSCRRDRLALDDRDTRQRRRFGQDRRCGTAARGAATAPIGLPSSRRPASRCSSISRPHGA